MSISESLKSRILDAIPIAQVIGEQVQLQERGNLKVGLCPFHDEKGASFTVYPDHYYCFGCKESGDAISFIRKTKALSFVDTLKYLAEKAGIDASELDGLNIDRKQREEEARLFRALVYAQEFFTKRLSSLEAASVRIYLEGRGFEGNQISAMGFGWAPDQMRSLTDELMRVGFKPREIEACSLASPSSKTGQLYDFYRNRLTIPIRDVHGRLVGFGGRAMDDYPPKYKNSRESRLFDKSNLLFGFEKAREAIRKGAPPILVEGYFDVLQLWQQGLPGAVACMGTALKHSHLRQISQVSHRAFLLFDGDAAGQKASLSTLSTALDIPKLEVFVVKLPPGDDPDSFVKREGKEALDALLIKAESLLDFAIKSRIEGLHGISLAECVRSEILPWLSQITDPFKLAVLINRVSALSGLDRALLERELQNSRRPRIEKMEIKETTANKAGGQLNPPRALKSLEYDLMGLIYWSEPNQLPLDELRAFLAQELELDEVWNELLKDMFTSLEKGQRPAAADKSLWSSINSPYCLKVFATLDTAEAAFTGIDGSLAFFKLRRQHNLKKRIDLVASMKKKLAGATPESIQQILVTIQSINKEIAFLEKSIK